MSHFTRKSIGTAVNVFEVYEDPLQHSHDIPAGNLVVCVSGVHPMWFIKLDDGDTTNVEQIIALNKWDATVAPAANDDIGDGYSPGSKWFDTVLAELWMCVDASIGAAVWIKLN